MNLNSQTNIFSCLSCLTESSPHTNLYIDFSHHVAYLKFKDDNAEIEYFRNLNKKDVPINTGTKLNEAIIFIIIYQSGLDIDGDVVSLDGFIEARNAITQKILSSKFKYIMEEPVMEKLTTIQKREKLNDVFRVDEKGPGGAYHKYMIVPFGDLDDNFTYRLLEKLTGNETPLEVGEITFQKGPRKDSNSQRGIIDTDLLEIVRDRLKCFQEGEFASEYNAKALEHVELALMYLNRRVEDRIERNVLGTNEK